MGGIFKRTGAVFTLAVLALLIFYYFPFLTGKACFYRDDVTAYYEPVIRFAVDTAHHGHLPLWDPWNYCGVPLAATTSPGIWYPPNWLFLLVPYSQGLAVSLLSHQLLASVSTYLLILSFGWGTLPAMTAAVIYSLSGYMFSLDENFSMVCGASWLPLCALLVFQLAKKPERSQVYFCLLALTLSLLIMSGRPEVFAPAITLLLVFSSAYDWAHRERNWNTIAWMVRAFVVAIMLSAPVLLPAIESVPWSVRQNGLALKDVLQFSSKWIDVIGIVMPQPVGDLHLFWGPHLDLVISCQDIVQFISSLYLTPLAIMLAIGGSIERGWNATPWIVAGVIGSLILAMGGTTPLGTFIFSILPGASMLRYPSKAMCFFNLFVAILAARGLTAARSNRFFIGFAVLWLATLGYGILIKNDPQLAFQLLQVDCDKLQLSNSSLNWLSDSVSRSFIVGSCLGLIGCLLGFVQPAVEAPDAVTSQETAHPLQSKLRFGQLARIGVALTILAALMTNASLYLKHEAPGAFFRAPSFVANLLAKLDASFDRSTAMQPRFMNFQMNCFGAPLNVMLANGAKDLHGATWRWFDFARQCMWRNANTDFRIASPFGEFSSVEPATESYLLWHGYDNSSLSSKYNSATEANAPAAFSEGTDAPASMYFRITSTRFITTGVYCVRQEHRINRLNPKYFELISEDQVLNLRVYRVKDPVPRAYLARRFKVLESHNAVVQAIADPAKSRFNPASETLLEDLPPADWHSQQSPSRSKSESIHCTQYDPGQTMFKVRANSAALFVLTDQFFPGWNAYIDSRPSRIYQLNGFMEGVFIPEGNHVVEFRYTPTSLLMGFVLAALGALILVVVAIKARGKNTLSRPADED